MSGTVTAVDTDNNVCTVQLTTDSDDNPTDGILLNVLTANINGVYLLPEVNADCIVAEIDGPGKWELLRASSYTKIFMQTGSSTITITDGLIQLNDGSLDGLVKVNDLVTKLNNLENDLNNLKTVFLSGWVVIAEDGGAALKTAAASWAGATLTDTVAGDIVNTKITQG